MILGPFWCQRDNSWLRFNIEKGIASAEVAKVSSNNPRETAPWQTVTEGSWPVSYEYGNKNPVKQFYSFKKGGLYFTEGREDPFNVGFFYASVYSKDGWSLY